MKSLQTLDAERPVKLETDVGSNYFRIVASDTVTRIECEKFGTEAMTYRVRKVLDDSVSEMINRFGADSISWRHAPSIDVMRQFDSDTFLIVGKARANLLTKEKLEE